MHTAGGNVFFLGNSQPVCTGTAYKVALPPPEIAGVKMEGRADKAGAVVVPFVKIYLIINGVRQFMQENIALRVFDINAVCI